MAESLESFKRYIGKSETATDVVTASAMLKFAATLGLENPSMEKGAPIPLGWYGAFFPASHRPSQMRVDGQASGGGIAPPIPLPRRRIGGTRVTFHEPLRIGDDISRVTEIADIQIDDGPSGAMATVIERNSISNSRGLAVVEERDLVMLSEARAEAAASTSPAAPTQATWRQVIEPNPPLLFRFSAIRFNSHRIHYDRDYVTKVEHLPGLVVQSSLISQLLIEMCRRELPTRQLASFGFKSVRQIYDTGKFTIAGAPATDGREATLWALDADGKLAMTATAKFA
ncbi:MAG TPA: MaoC family dehydratase N-terminal domain-containing protein [Candidatus Binatia bacterium]|jgi:3-methylfumaryl-CoA hydratase|nr:MaoC family dehydratase N-terminal domain-containing protein [Candidatus Binatia bacterium]